MLIRGAKPTFRFVFLICANLIFSNPNVSAENDEKICSDKDIRNNVTNFYQLENCTVIEGYLQILLIDEARPNDYENITFPKLREVTEFLLFYRVAGLKSLRNLFPNLSVIRGTRLFHNFAFVVYEMMALEDIAMPSLTYILRGSVRISRNPQLCYVNTIDWDLIAKNGVGGHVINHNKERNECTEQCPDYLGCPVSRGKRVCWNKEQCQKVCDPKCGNNSCFSSDTSRCCSRECLGDCYGPNNTNCFACAGVKFEGKCLKRCLPGTFKFADRRCLNKTECINLPEETWDGHDYHEVHWKPFQDECRHECPPGYMEDETNVNNCIPCVNRCPKVCDGAVVDSVASAEMLRGCTRISGSLEIQVSGGANIVRELEENLRALEEVDGFVKVSLSAPLITLHFLRNLKKISGMEKEFTEYSFLVLDNMNLQELWDLKNTSHKLKIVSGKIFFHLNPHLCVGKIKAFSDYLGLPEWEERDVSSKTNGARIACNMKRMRAVIRGRTPTTVVAYWENVQGNFSDYRSLLGYRLSYKEAPVKNVSIFDGRDACSGDSWKEFTLSPTEGAEFEGFIIFNLKPFTQYALFVRTYTTFAENYGAQSDLLYFTTLPDYPSNPIDLKAVSNGPFELTLSWRPPVRPNGKVTRYLIKGTLEKDEHEHFDDRDYCKDHFEVMPPPKHEILPPIVNKTENEAETEGPYEVSEEKLDIENEVKQADIENQFENSIHNHVYVKRDDFEDDEVETYAARRNKRSIVKNSVEETNRNLTSKLLNGTKSKSVPSTFFVSSSSSETTIKRLGRFSKYVVEVFACHDEMLGGLCGSKAIISVRTAPLADADTIDKEYITLAIHENETQVRWVEPEEPNGLIVAFEVEYKRNDIENYKPVIKCITHRQYRIIKGHNLTNLRPGNYSLRLRALSLAGYGNWTLPIIFQIMDNNYILAKAAENAISSDVLAIIATSIVLVFVGIVCYVIWIIFKRKHAEEIANGILYASVNPKYVLTGNVYIADEWEVPREIITMLGEIGQGSFGMVYSGIINYPDKGEVKCAIKTVNESASVRERIEFLKEASVMKAFSSYHVLKLMGVVSLGQPTLVIMELMTNGDLKAHLRSLRPDAPDAKKNLRQPPTLNDVFRMSSEIADGMAYLAAKKFVHRDLAARNCMVSDNLIVKIGDFGMTRDIYETDYYRKGGEGLLPVRWMAPESLKDGLFTSLSDAWSFGIVLWEMATLASQPYQGLSHEQVLRYVTTGGVMEKPNECPDKLYDLMKRCWNPMPKLRPTFVDLVEFLLPHVRPSFVTESFYFSEETERFYGCSIGETKSTQVNEHFHSRNSNVG